MILNVSGRTDIVAFYTKWFMNRYKAGFVDVRNPFNAKLVSRIYFDDVDLIMFCTKNPLPIIPFLKEIKKPILFHVTLTPYKNDVEVNVPNKNEIIDGVKEISDIVGVDNIFIRYDPIFVNEKYNVDYHIKAFDKLCNLLDGYVKHFIISFIDDYKNVRNNIDTINYKNLKEDDYKKIGINFSNSAKKYGMTVQTCFEERNLIEYGFIKSDCITKELVYDRTGKIFNKKWKARGCNCVQMVDVGVYNSCKHFCKYCYANYDERKVINNFKKHNPKSSLLVGELMSDDEIKVRKK